MYSFYFLPHFDLFKFFKDVNFANKFLVPTFKESDGIFVLRVFFFARKSLTFELAMFDGIFVSFQRYCCLELKFKPVIISCKVMGLKDCRFGIYFVLLTRKRTLVIRIRNSCKLD